MKINKHLLFGLILAAISASFWAQNSIGQNSSDPPQTAYDLEESQEDAGNPNANVEMQGEPQPFRSVFFEVKGMSRFQAYVDLQKALQERFPKGTELFKKRVSRNHFVFLLRAQMEPVEMRDLVDGMVVAGKKLAVIQSDGNKIETQAQ